jgi:hypothetical protein
MEAIVNKVNGKTETNAKSESKPRKPVTVQTKGPQAVKEVKAVAYSYSELDFKAADKAIKAIGSRGASLRKLAHETAVGIMMHYVKHGDNTKLNELRTAIRESISVNMGNAFVDWVKRFSNNTFENGKFIKTERGKDNPAKFCGMSADNFDVKALVIGREVNGVKFVEFWNLEREATAFIPVDFADRLEALLKLGERLLTEKTKGKEVTKADGTKEIVKVPHEHINKRMLADLTAFATEHGVTVETTTAQ